MEKDAREFESTQRVYDAGERQLVYGTAVGTFSELTLIDSIPLDSRKGSPVLYRFPLRPIMPVKYESLAHTSETLLSLGRDRGMAAQGCIEYRCTNEVCMLIISTGQACCFVGILCIPRNVSEQQKIRVTRIQRSIQCPSEVIIRPER